MIINIRGTHGSGKSTVIRQMIQRYGSDPTKCQIGDGRKVCGYSVPSPFGTIRVVGSYRNECGGCDGIQPYANIWPRVVDYANGAHVLFEGALVSNSYGNIGRDSEVYGDDFVFAFLDTPLEVCIERIMQRRAAKGNTKPFDPNKSVVRIYKSNESVLRKVKELGRRYVILNHQRPLPQVIGLLNASHKSSTRCH